MQTLKLTSCLLFLQFLHTAQCVTQYPPNLGGGAGGSDGNAHIAGSRDTPKLEARVHCTKSLSTSTLVDMTITVYQADVNFKYSNIGPDSGKYVQYESCRFINTQDYLSTKKVDLPSSTSSCGNTAAFSRVDSASTFDSGYKTRTFKQTISFTPSDSTYSCGGLKTAGQAVFAVYCKRDNDYAKAFDYVFLVYYDADAATCLTRQVQFAFNVGNPPIVNIRREYDVTFLAYTDDDIKTWPAGPQSSDSAKITAPIELGTAMYLEACLRIPNLPNNQPGYNQFFNDGVAPIGIFVKKCTASVGTNTVASPTSVTFMENGCSKNVDPTKLLPVNTHAFKYVKDTVDSTKDWLRSPNCFRSYPFEAVSFARQIVTQTATVKYECELEYCTSSDDNRCFGTKTATDLSGYPTCQLSGRRKRDDGNVTSFYPFPDKVSLTVEVVPPGYNPRDDCGETLTMIALTVVLAAVLVLILGAAGFMSKDLHKLSHRAQKAKSLSAVPNLGFS